MLMFMSFHTSACTSGDHIFAAARACPTEQHVGNVHKDGSSHHGTLARGACLHRTHTLWFLQAAHASNGHTWTLCLPRRTDLPIISLHVGGLRQPRAPLLSSRACMPSIIIQLHAGRSCTQPLATSKLHMLASNSSMWALCPELADIPIIVLLELHPFQLHASLNRTCLPGKRACAPERMDLPFII